MSPRFNIADEDADFVACFDLVACFDSVAFGFAAGVDLDLAEDLVAEEVEGDGAAVVSGGESGVDDEAGPEAGDDG